MRKTEAVGSLLPHLLLVAPLPSSLSPSPRIGGAAQRIKEEIDTKTEGMQLQVPPVSVVQGFGFRV